MRRLITDYPGDRRTARMREDAKLRLARITNDADPAYKNGHPKAAEKKGRKNGRR